MSNNKCPCPCPPTVKNTNEFTFVKNGVTLINLEKEDNLPLVSSASKFLKKEVLRKIDELVAQGEITPAEVCFIVSVTDNHVRTVTGKSYPPSKKPLKITSNNSTEITTY